MTRLYLVRHGQTDLNRERRFRGMSDAPLNDAGREETAAAGRFLTARGVTTIFTSPVPRARETAMIVGELTGARVEVEEGLTDIDYGDWQGLTVEEVAERFNRHMVESWKREPGSFRFPGGDSMAGVFERVRPTLLRLAKEADGATIAAVSHLAVLRICFVAAMGLDLGHFWRVDLDPGSVGAFRYEGEGRFLLESWNVLPR